MKKDTHQKFNPGVTRIKYGGAYTDKEDFKAIQAVLDRNWWTIDEEADLLEASLTHSTKVEDVVLTNSGSSALLVAMGALDYVNGAEIITGAVQFPTTISALYYNRLTPVFVDNEISTLGMNIEEIKKAITNKTRAILVVTIAGAIPHIDKLKELADENGLDLILDNCDGFGGTYGGEPIEHYFDVSCTSFHAAHIVTMGEGGAIFCNDVETAERARSLREWGRIGDSDDNSKYEDIPEDYPGRYIFKNIGFNVKPLELQCAMGRTQLRKLQDIKEKRKKIYASLKSGMKNIRDVQVIESNKASSPSWFAFPMIVRDRPALRKFLEDRNIETRTIFGGNITKQPAFKKVGRVVGKLHVADTVMRNGMFVSVHPTLTKSMTDYIIRSVKEFYG